MVGFIALGLLVGGAALSVLPSAQSDAQFSLWQGACVRVGVVMAALWLALPSIQHENRYARAMGMGLVGVILLGVFLKRVPLRFLIPGALAVMGLGLILRPRPKHRPRNRL